MIINESILAAGGDTRYSFILSTISMWGVGVPLVYIAGSRMGFPIYIVSIFTFGEEIVKLVFGYLRFWSKKWIRNVTVSDETIRIESSG